MSLSVSLLQPGLPIWQLDAFLAEFADPFVDHNQEVMSGVLSFTPSFEFFDRALSGLLLRARDHPR
jgi:hypothetical protein